MPLRSHRWPSARPSHAGGSSPRPHGFPVRPASPRPGSRGDFRPRGQQGPVSSAPTRTPGLRAQHSDAFPITCKRPSQTTDVMHALGKQSVGKEAHT